MRRICRLLFSALLVSTLAGCGGGTLKDLFGIFPATAFTPSGGGGTPGGGGGVTGPKEVASLTGSQGVKGNVHNIVVAPVTEKGTSKSFAFLAAGSDGLHIVDVTSPATPGYRATIPTSLLAGGRSDALAVVGQTYLVSVAIGPTATDTNGNGVTVFRIQTLDDQIVASQTNPDFSPALIPRMTGVIAAPGNGDGKGGGVSGATSSFLVATGGNELDLGIIVPSGASATWSASAAPAPFPLTSPSVGADTVTNFFSVLVNGQNAYVSVETSASTFGILGLDLTATNPITTPALLEVPGDFAALATHTIVGPGNFGLDLAQDATNKTLYVTGDNQVYKLDITDPSVPTSPVLAADTTGLDTISVASQNGTVAVGAGNLLRIYQDVQTNLVLGGTVTFATTTQVKAVAIRATSASVYVLCCGGNNGLRVVQAAGR